MFTFVGRQSPCGFSALKPRPVSALPARRLLNQALAEEGIAIVGESDTVEAGVEMSRALRPEVVLMDLRLPDGSGIEATRRIKHSVPYVQVLLLTAHDGELPSRSAHAVGAYAYLVKGCPVSLIRDMVMSAATWCRALRQENIGPRTAIAGEK